MTPEEASSLAARTFAAIDSLSERFGITDRWHAQFDADRARVASDLAGLHRHSFDGNDGCDFCQERAYGYPCADAAVFEAGLRRTADLYGNHPVTIGESWR